MSTRIDRKSVPNYKIYEVEDEKILESSFN